MSTPRRLAVAVGVPAVLATGLAVALPAEAATPGYQGSSFAIKVQVGLAGTTLLNQILPDAITYPAGGETALLELPPELSEVATLKILNAASGVTKDQVLASNARTAQLSVLNDLVTASVLNSDCTAENLKLAGDSQVTGLAIAGTRIPIDPGPNFKVEIPTALAPFLSGGIYIDEQDTLSTGDLRVRALHVRLVVDPLGLQTALKALTDEVRKVAEEVTGAVEKATGKTLEALEAQARTARAAVAPVAATATASTPKATTVDPVAGSHQNHAGEVRSAAEQKSAHERLVAQRDAEAAAAEKRAIEAQGRADAAADAAAKATAAAEQSDAGASQGSGAEQSTAEVKKSDRAAVPGRDARAGNAPGSAAPGSAAPGSDAAGGTTVSQAGGQSSTESWQDRAGRLRPEQAQEAAAKAQADATDARTAADAAQARAKAARGSTANGAAAAASTPGARVAAKADRASVPAAGRAAPAVPAADPDNLGTVGVDVIVSQVTCKGFQAVKAVNKPPPADASSINKPDLPKTGGNGNATAAIGIAGLGLLAVGSCAVFAVRRRGRHTA